VSKSKQYSSYTLKETPYLFRGNILFYAGHVEIALLAIPIYMQIIKIDPIIGLSLGTG
jgi:hypothetical protein